MLRCKGAWLLSLRCGARAIKLAEIETALHKAKRHELILMEQLEAQEAKRLVAEGTPQGSDVWEGVGENDRALSVESDDELAGGLDPDDEVRMPPEYLEGHEPNKRPRMVVKPKAAPGPSTAQGFGLPKNDQHAVAMLSGFDSNQLSLLVQAAQMVQGGSSPSPGSDADAWGFCG